VFWRRDATPIRVESTAAPMVDDEGRIAGAVTTFRDISRQKQMEQQIEQSARVASLGRVSASVAPEFNNLLMGLGPSVDVLRRKAEGDPALELNAVAARTAAHRRDSAIHESGRAAEGTIRRGTTVSRVRRRSGRHS